MLITPFSDQPTDALRTAVNSLRADRENVQRIWIFDPEQRRDDDPSPPAISFGSDSGLRFVAPFAPGRLMYFDAVTQKYRPAKRRTILGLDSNLCSLLREVFVHGSDDPTRTRRVIDLAKHARIWRAEVQPMLYLRELVLRLPIADLRNDAEKAVVSMFKMQALRPQSSEGAGRLIFDEAILDHFEERFGVRTFEEAASKQVDLMLQKGDVGHAHDHIVIYAALLKMIDVGLAMKQRPLDERLAEVDAFIVRDLASVQPRLHVLARLFFSGTLARLLKITAGNPNFGRKHLIGSSYDLYLTIIHENFLGTSDEPPEAWLSILCTLDEGLSNYAGRFPLVSLAVMNDYSFRIAHQWDDAWLKNTLGVGRYDELVRSVNERVPSVKTSWLTERTIAMIRDIEARLGVTAEQSLLGDATAQYIIAGTSFGRPA
ncbi:MAG TPA: hypothetical protein VMD91_16150 [Candidatus Sulfotelmatobacter sp.]|nr:hypothetical protein [Candidatus Sulfotelmatobacter sp.]